MLPPKTPKDMAAFVTVTLFTRLYGDLALEARRQGFAEHDIRLIENRVIRIFREGKDFSHEVEEYGAEPDMADIEAYLRATLAAIRDARRAEIGRKQ